MTSRRKFIRNAAGILVPGIITPQLARAVSLVSQSGPRKFGHTFGGGSGTIAAGAQFMDVNFENLANGASITSMVDFWGTQGSGAHSGGTSGCYGDTTTKRPGKTSSLRMSILSGSTGRPGDGAAATEGDFGFIKTFPASVLNGGDIRVGEWCYFPVGFSFHTPSTGVLKFHRFDQDGYGRIELEILSGLLDGLSPVGDSYGWAPFNEAFAQLQSETLYRSSSRIVPGNWHWVEQYIHVSSTPASAIRRWWIDNVMIGEQVGGNSMTYLDNAGAYQTRSFASPVPTLPSSGSFIPNFYLHTYWNLGSPQNQSRYCSRIIISNNNETASDLVLDSRGNKMIGMSYV